MKTIKKHLIIPTSILLAVPVVAYAETGNVPSLTNTPTIEDTITDNAGTIEVNQISEDLKSKLHSDSPETEVKGEEEKPRINDSITPSEIGIILENGRDDAFFAYKDVNYSYSYRNGTIAVMGSTLASLNTLEIPPKFGNAIVTSVASNAFKGILINQISIPDTVRTIGQNAFLDSKVKLLYLGNGVTNIGSYAFSGNYLQTVALPSSLATLGEGAFYNGTIINLTLSSTLMDIPAKAFANNQISLLNVPSNVRTIGNMAFANNKISSLVVMKGLTSIGDNAFMNNQISDVYIPSTVSILGNLAYYGNPVKSVVMPQKLNFYLSQITTNASGLDYLQLFEDNQDPGSTNSPMVSNSNQNSSLTDILTMQIKQGSFGIVKPKFASNSFGTFDLSKNELQKELGFSSDLYVVDMSGSGRGWSVSVQATQFEEVKPSNGGVAPSGGWLKLPKGSLKLTGVGNAYKINQSSSEKTKSDALVVSSSESPIDSAPVTLLSVDGKNSYGAFGLDMSQAKLVLNLDTSTALVDAENYPNSPTPYTTTITWTLTAGPGN